MISSCGLLSIACTEPSVDILAETTDGESRGDDPGESTDATGEPEIPDAIGTETDGECSSGDDCLPLVRGCSSGAGAEQLAVGSAHTCVRQHDGKVHCWGWNRAGQLGLGHTMTIGDDEHPSVAGPVPLPDPVVSLAAGGAHTCALLEGGELICWGHNDGELGRGDLAYIGNDEVPTLADAVDVGAEVAWVRAGGRTTCAITSTQALVCWGRLGVNVPVLGYASSEWIGDDEPPSAAGTIDVGGPVIDVAIGNRHICALLHGGVVRCWGDEGPWLGADRDQAIGDDEAPSTVPPIDLAGPAIAIAAGSQHACALLDDGSISCWGRGAEGQLGHGDDDDITTPASVGPVQLGAPATAIALGSKHSCALAADGSMYCWGEGWEGQLGYPNVVGRIGEQLEPIDVGPIALPGPVLEIGAGGSHTCARIGLDVHCWGDGRFGQTGHASEQDIGDDESPASSCPVDYPGPGTLAPAVDAHDGVVDAQLLMAIGEIELPIDLDPGQTIRVRGVFVGCEACEHTFTVWTEDAQTLLVAKIFEHDQLHPDPGQLAVFGLDAAGFTAPLTLAESDAEVCPSLLDQESEPCTGEGRRLLLEIGSPEHPPARLLDGTHGQVGAGYWAAIDELEQWTTFCDHHTLRSFVIVRQDCAPDCGPVATVDSCAPDLGESQHAALWFEAAAEPSEPAYDISCVILDRYLGVHGEWVHELDCVGVP